MLQLTLLSIKIITFPEKIEKEPPEYHNNNNNNNNNNNIRSY